MASVVKLEAAHKSLGIWSDSPAGRHRYRLIPGNFTVTDDMSAQFSSISTFVGRALRASASLSNAVERERIEKGTLPSKVATFRTMIRSACGGYEFRPGITSLPPLVKVDLMWDGTQFWIAEIDTYNPRGIAYALWLREAHVLAEEPEADHLALVDELRASCSPGGGILWLYSERERYYAPVMETAARILAKHGVSMRVVGEASIGSICSETGEGLLIDNEQLLIIPDRMHKNAKLRDALVTFSRSRPDRLVFPYVPHLGSKAFLAFLKNGNNDGDIAAWRDRHLCRVGQEGAERFLPWTGILGKRFEQSFRSMRPERIVLKDANGSGTRGVYMPDNPAQGVAVEAALRQRKPGYIAQECVQQQPMRFEGPEGIEEHFVRVTLYVKPTEAGGIPVDAELTGTGANNLVHGGSSCIQLPAIF